MNIIILFIHILLFSKMTFISNPEFYIYPYLANQNWKPYTQIIDQHMPGLLMLSINFNTLGFSTPHDFKTLLTLIIIFQSLLIYKITKNNWAVFAYCILQLLFSGNNLWYDTILAPFVLAAFYFYRRKKLFLTFLVLCAGLWFKQTILILILFLVFKTRYWKGLIMLLLFILLTFFYFFTQGVISDFLHWTIVFNLTTYPELSGLLPTLGQSIKLVAVVILSIISWQESVVWAFSTLFFGLGRFSFEHLHTAVPLFSIAIGTLWKKWFVEKKNLFLTSSLIVLIMLFFISYIKQLDLNKYKFFEMDDMILVNKIEALTQIDKKIFLLGTQPHVYQLSNTLPFNNKFFFIMPWYLVELEKDLISDLVRTPPHLVVINTDSKIDGQSINSYADKIIRFVLQNYREVDHIGDNIIYVRL